MPQPIHIALCFDDPYWAPAYAVMRSICLTTLRRTDLTFHLFHPPLQPDHLGQLEEIGVEFGASLRHYDPTTSQVFAEITARLPSNPRFPAIVYTRVLLDRLLPPEVERIIYLDCDTMVRRPIEELYFSDMAGRPIAAVAEPYHDIIKRGRDIRTRTTLFDPAEPYFNSGVLLIDLRAFAALQVPDRIDHLHQNGGLADLYYDQDLLNHLVLRNWTELDWRFNVLMPRRMHEVMGPSILHFTEYKPWIRPRQVAFGRIYRHVMTNRVYYWYRRERLAKRLPKLLRGIIRTRPAA